MSTINTDQYNSGCGKTVGLEKIGCLGESGKKPVTKTTLRAIGLIALYRLTLGSELAVRSCLNRIIRDCLSMHGQRMDQPGKVANPTQLSAEGGNTYFPVPVFAPENLVHSRPVPLQPAHFPHSNGIGCILTGFLPFSPRRPFSADKEWADTTAEPVSRDQLQRGRGKNIFPFQ